MILLFLFLTYWLGLSFRYCWYVFAILSILLLLIIYRRTNKKVFFLSLGIFCLGLINSSIKMNQNYAYRQGIVYEVKENYYLFNSNGERLYVYEKDNTREIGDILRLEGEKTKLDFNTLESAFDFTQYLNKKGVFSEYKVRKATVKFSSPLKLQRAKKYFLSGFDGNTKTMISSILFSQGDDSDLNDNIRSLHLGKFISANGTYIYLFVGFFGYLLSFLIKKKWAEVGSILICLIYLIFVFPKFSSIRILFLLIFRWLNKYVFKQKFDYLAIIGISGIFFLAINPYLALQDSFILGYAIPLGIFFIREALKQHGVVLKKLFAIILIYLFIIPFEIKFYNSISPLSMVFQILLTPLFLIIGLLSLLCFFRIPLKAPLKLLCDFLSSITSGLKSINFSFNIPPLNAILVLTFYFLFFVLLFLIKIKFKPLIKVVVSSQLLFLLFYIVPINNMISQEVTFINVGQGDACLIRDKNKTILVDTGGLSYIDIGKDCLIPFLKKKRIYKLDIVIGTHNHYDHIGALDTLVKDFKVKSFINNKDRFPLQCGSLTFRNYNLKAGEYDDENTNSLVIGFRLGKRDYLITGDATTTTEKAIMEDFASIPCDILKVGHHGSNTSSSTSFLKYLSPKEAVISVGKNNSYKLPDDSTLIKFKNLKIPVKRTDYLGSITYKNYIFNA